MMMMQEELGIWTTWLIPHLKSNNSASVQVILIV